MSTPGAVAGTRPAPQEPRRRRRSARDRAESLQQATVSAIGSRPGRVAVYGAVVAAADEVTVEEFRLADLRCEQDARQGRRLLYLVSNTEWVRRTTEHVEIGRARVVDTEVVVDVDLSYLPHALLDDDVVWLPVLAVPPPVPEAGGSTERDPVTSMEVTDAAGARVSKAPQSQVHRRLAAALAELVLGRLPRGRPDGGSGPTRDEQVLLSAALRRLLPGPADDDGAPADDDDAPAMLDRGRAQVEERLIVARLGLLHAVRLDLARPRPVLRSRLVEMVAALVGVVHAVVPVPVDAGPTSLAVRLPDRRLRPEHRRRLWAAPRTHLRVGLHAASPHSDGVVHLALPDGMAVSDRTRPDAAPAGARIALTDVRPVEELRALMALVLPGRRGRTADDGAPGTECSRTRRQLAGPAADKVEASLEALQHLRAPAGSDDPVPALLHGRAAYLVVLAPPGPPDSPNDDPPDSPTERSAFADTVRAALHPRDVVEPVPAGPGRPAAGSTRGSRCSGSPTAGRCKAA